MLLLSKDNFFIGAVGHKNIYTPAHSFFRRTRDEIVIPIREVDVVDLITMRKLVDDSACITHAHYFRGNDKRLELAVFYYPDNDTVEVLYSRTPVTRNDQEVTAADLGLTRFRLTEVYVPISVSSDYTNLNWGSLNELRECTLDHFMQWSRQGGQKWAGGSYTQLSIAKLKQWRKDTSMDLQECFNPYFSAPELFFDIRPRKKPIHYLTIGNAKWNPKEVQVNELQDMFGHVPKLKANVFKSFKLINQF